MDVDPKKLRGWARLLSTLLRTPDDELDDFARERLSKPDLDVGDLAEGRELLFYVARALEEPTEDRWQGLAYARKSLDQWEEGMKQGTGAAAERGDAAAATPEPASAPPAASPLPSPAAVGVPSPVGFGHRAPPGPSPWAGAAASPSVGAASPAGAPAPPSPVAPGPAAPSPVAPGPAAPSPVAPGPAAPSPVAPGPAAPGPVSPAVLSSATLSPVAAAAGAQAAHGDAKVLPFQGNAPAPPKISEHLGENPALGATAFQPSSGSGGNGGPTMPFRTVPDQRPSASDPMPLQTYAAFCVERTLWPDNVAGRNQRFSLAPGDEERIDAHFKAKFAETPKLRMEWLQLCAQHKATLT